jgi:hypothetical protein
LVLRKKLQAIIIKHVSDHAFCIWQSLTITVLDSKPLVIMANTLKNCDTVLLTWYNKKVFKMTLVFKNCF